jgi:hypothetical protein
MPSRSKRLTSAHYVHRWEGDRIDECVAPKDFGPDAQIIYYDSFVRELRKQPSKTKGSKSDDAVDTGTSISFKRGDAVVVNANSRLHSVGIIAQLWDVVNTGSPSKTPPLSGMRATIRWFYKVSELAQYRAQRPCLEVSQVFTPFNAETNLRRMRSTFPSRATMNMMLRSWIENARWPVDNPSLSQGQASQSSFVYTGSKRSGTYTTTLILKII